MYKVGDRLLCKKDYKYKVDIIFNEGEYYEITEVKIGHIRLGRYKWGFLVDGGLYEFFYTTIELRKIKLERLQCIK